MKRYILAAILFLSLSACRQQVGYDASESFTFSAFKETVNLHGEVFAVDKPVMKPHEIYVIDSLIFLINTDTEYLFQCFNTNTGKEVKEFISFGSGPEEMINPQSLDQKDSFVYIFDVMKRRIFLYDKTSFLSLEEPQSSRQIDLKDMFSNVFLLSKDQIVATGLQPDSKRFTFFNNEGDVLTHKGEFPSFQDSAPSKFEKAHNYECEMTYNAELQRLSLSYKYTDLIEFYNLEGDLLKRIHGPEQFLPAFSEKKTGNSIRVLPEKGKSRDGYISPVSYKDELYVLYSGKVFDPKTRPYLDNQILVFDWSGKPLKRLFLDKPIYRFTIDKKKNILYGLSFSPDFHIVKYRLK